jgi:1-acyl-sn-glycerol-3-phosphate acyltransferase
VFLRSILFEIFLAIWGIIIPVIYSVVFIGVDSKHADKGALIWSKLIVWMLKYLCGIDYEVRGQENLPKEGGFIIACQHQSAWETMIMHLIFNRPVYAYKKELLKIPFYGWYLRKMSGIAVDREGGMKALKSLIQDSDNYLKKDRQIIIFPQGTRVPIGANDEDYPYQAGITAIYSKLKCKIIPAALNSGYFWNKNKFFKRKGKIILEFLPQIDPKTDKKDFITELSSKINQKSKELSSNL